MDLVDSKKNLELVSKLVRVDALALQIDHFKFNWEKTENSLTSLALSSLKFLSQRSALLLLLSSP